MMTISPRWRKMLRDFTGDKVRASLMLSALVVGIFAVTAILSTHAILAREMKLNYMLTNPASATLALDEVISKALESARNFPGIAMVEARSILDARVRVGDSWKPMLIFIIDDFDQVRLNTFTHLAGIKSPATGTILIERTAPDVLLKGLDDKITIQSPHGKATQIEIVGIVHDATLAPARQQQTGYGYITKETLALLGEKNLLNELRIQLTGNPEDSQLIEETASALSQLLTRQGHHIHEIRVPPPLTHPHETQMVGVLRLFLTFAIMAFLLSTVLTATIVAALLSRQVREIGIMKAIGARSSQIRSMYFVMLVCTGLFSAMIGIPSGLFLASVLVDLIAELLNLEIYSYVTPLWIHLSLIGSSMVIPPLVALGVIVKGTSLTVREAISDNGVSEPNSSGGFSVGWMSLSWRMAFRNIFRRRARLYLSLVLLSIGGGMFISALNINASWAQIIDRIYIERSYDVEFVLNASTPKYKVTQALSAIDQIKQLELWGSASVNIAEANKVEISRAYPDGAHGSFHLMGVPAGEPMINFPLMAGRWLQDGDESGIVINQIARAMAQGAEVNDKIWLSIEGHAKHWQVVGIVEEIGSGATAYTLAGAFEQAAGTEDHTQLIRIAGKTSNPDELVTLIRHIDDRLSESGISVKTVVPLTMLKTSMGEHVEMVVVTLIFMAILLGLIGLLGLTSTISMNVLERTREIGIMKVGGATPAYIQKVIVNEGLFIALKSWMLAILVSLPLSKLIGDFIGKMSFETPLGLHISWFAVLLWFVVVLVLAAAASYVPARKAARQPIYEAITYG